jgi:hypothetical protein
MGYSGDVSWLEGRQPNFHGLFRYAVSARASSRVNINTASLPVLSACLTEAPLTPAWFVENRPFTGGAQSICDNETVGGLFFGDGNDGNGNNAKDEHDEKTEWLIRYSSLFAFHANCFAVQVEGTVRDGSGQIKARDGLDAMFDRGRRITSSGVPLVIRRYNQAP